MLLRLLSALDVPLRQQNEVLRAAAFAPRFAEPLLAAIDPSVDNAITRMMQQQEPYPLTVMTAGYDIVRSNDAARRIFGHFAVEQERLQVGPNLFDIVFDPHLARPFIKNWEQVGQRMVARLHREALRETNDSGLWSLLDRVLSFPDVPRSWRQPDFAAINEPFCPLILERGSITLGFLTTVTAFSAPQQVTVEELRIESYFPLDEKTQAACGVYFRLN